MDRNAALTQSLPDVSSPKSPADGCQRRSFCIPHSSDASVEPYGGVAGGTCLLVTNRFAGGIALRLTD
jgi:hypothetical protein